MSTAKKRIQTVDEYIGTFPKDVQTILESIREVVRLAELEGEEIISYQLPALKYQGKNLVFYSAYKDHYSISVSPPFHVFEEFKEELSPYELAKTSVKFPLDQPVPSELIKKIVQYKAKEVLDRTKKKKK